tara:strand:- start:3 stop:182 length:180 start_codon:yes stop_codon:yes gene_type:complete
MKNISMKNLIIVAHPDDEILGFGGTGASLTSKGDEIFTDYSFMRSKCMKLSLRYKHINN